MLSYTSENSTSPSSSLTNTSGTTTPSSGTGIHTAITAYLPTTFGTRFTITRDGVAKNYMIFVSSSIVGVPLEFTQAVIGCYICPFILGIQPCSGTPYSMQFRVLTYPPSSFCICGFQSAVCVHLAVSFPQLRAVRYANASRGS